MRSDCCILQVKLTFVQFIEICRRKDASCTFVFLPAARISSNDRKSGMEWWEGTEILDWIWNEWKDRNWWFTAARIKRNKKSSQIKFKVRCQRHLYTLVLKDTEKAEKLKQSLPPSTFSPGGDWEGNCGGKNAVAQQRGRGMRMEIRECLSNEHYLTGYLQTSPSPIPQRRTPREREAHKG